MLKHILKKKQYKGSYKGAGLKKHLSLWNLIFFGIASIIGGGSFSTIGQAAASGGPAVIFLFFIIALVCCLVAFSYAELASKFPLSGSAYTYSYIIFGEIIAWLVGWTLIIEYTVGNIVVAISFSEYLVSVLHNINIESLGIYGLDIPKWLTSNFFDVLSNYKKIEENLLGAGIKNISPKLVSDWNLYKSAPRIFNIPIIINLPAFLVTLFVSYFAYIGIKMSNKANSIMVTIKFVVVIVIVIAGLFYIKVDNWVPFMPEAFDNMLSGLAAIFFGYVGFDAISMVAEEAKNPKKDVPRSLIISLIICSIVYILIALTITGMASYKELNIANPLSYVFNKVNNSPLVLIVSIGILISMMNALMAFQVAQPRLLMNMSRDKLLPRSLSRVHNKYKTPYLSTILVAMMVAVPASVAGFNFAIDLTSIGALFVFMIVCLAAVKIRLDNEYNNDNKNFKIPFVNSKYILFPTIILASIYLVVFKKQETLNFITNNKAIKSKEMLESSLSRKDIENLKFFFQDTHIYNCLKNLSYKDKASLFKTFNIDENKVYYSSLNTFLINAPRWLIIIAIIISFCISLTYKISLLPLMGFLFCLYFALELNFNTWLGFFIWLFIGILIYFICSYKRLHT